MYHLQRNDEGALNLNPGQVAKVGRSKKFPSLQHVEADLRVSGHHCTFHATDDCLQVTDCSTNGTFVNGHLVGKGNVHTLQVGDIITLCFKSCEEAVAQKFPVFTFLSASPSPSLLSADPSQDLMPPAKATNAHCEGSLPKQDIAVPTPLPGSRDDLTLSPSLPPATTAAEQDFPATCIVPEEQETSPSAEGMVTAVPTVAHPSSPVPDDATLHGTTALIVKVHPKTNELPIEVDSDSECDPIPEDGDPSPNVKEEHSMDTGSQKADAIILTPTPPGRPPSPMTQTATSSSVGPHHLSPPHSPSALDSQVAVWYYKEDLETSEGDEEGWAPYPEHHCKKMEAAFQAKKEVVQLNGLYSVHFADQRQFRTQDRDRQRPVKRVLQPESTTPWKMGSAIKEVPDLKPPKPPPKPKATKRKFIPHTSDGDDSGDEDYKTGRSKGTAVKKKLKKKMEG